MGLRIRLESPRQPDVIALVDALDAFQKPLYPAESHHGIDLDALSAPEVLFAVARDAWGQAVACGAMVLEADHGELKRMYTVPAWRGRGRTAVLVVAVSRIASALLAVPAFFADDVPAGARAGAAVVIVLAAVSAALLFRTMNEPAVQHLT